MVKRYLRPQNGPILEGGCGSGIHVAALTNSGYRCIGVDYAPATVELLNRHMPELDVRLGDVRNLPFGEDCFAGYISIGVLEHFWDGYEPIIDEMLRVIRPGGYLFLAFPYMSPIRRAKGELGCYKAFDGHKPKDFYQFALDHRTVASDLHERGFRLIKEVPHNPNQGLWEEVPVLGPVFDPQNRNILVRLLRKPIGLMLSPFVCHSTLLVFRKGEGRR
jgi:SAM-dependent methyltransferase